MSFKKIKISLNPPRDYSHAQLSFSSGLGLSRFMAFFLILAGIGMSIMLLFVWNLPKGAIPFGLAIVIGGLIEWRIRVKIATRKMVYTKGIVCSGTVITHSRKFNPFRSKPNYTVTLKLDKSVGVSKNKHKMIHPNPGIWDVCSVNAQIFGLVYEGNYLFGPEVERVFEVDY